MELTDIPQILDNMLSKQKEKRAKTFVAKYKGQNLIVKSGKSSWKAIGHVKTAIIQHFHGEEYRYHGYGPDWREKKEQFRAELFKLIDIVELTD